MQVSGKSALIANPIQALQEFYVNEATEENVVDKPALTRLVKQQKNTFPKYIEQVFSKLDIIFIVVDINEAFNTNDIKGTTTSNKENIEKDYKILPDQIKEFIRKDNELHNLMGLLGYEYKEL